MCSPTSRVADSPVVPTATMALVPSCRWKSTSLLRAFQSRPPCASMGVTNATILPAIMQPLLPGKKRGNGTGATALAQARHRGCVDASGSRPQRTRRAGQPASAARRSSPRMYLEDASGIPLAAGFRYPSGSAWHRHAALPLRFRKLCMSTPPVREQFLVISALGPNAMELTNVLCRAGHENRCAIESTRLTRHGEYAALVLQLSGSWDALARLEGSLPALAKRHGC